MALLKLAIPPSPAGYKAASGDGVLSAKLDGGGSRQRLDLIGAAGSGTITWTTDAAGYAYLQAFWRQTGAKGLPFLIDLILETSALVEHTAKFLGPLSAAEKSGTAYRLSAEIEVTPVATVDATDAATIAAYTP